MNLEGKIIIITGGSQGFGKALAKAFRKEGSTIIISGNDEQALKSTAKELLIEYFTTDVTSPNDIKKLGEFVVQKYGKIDLWINNAGVQIAPNQTEEVDIEKLQRLFDINFFGYFYGCQTALTYFKKQGNGVIININSTAGLNGKPLISAYSSSKFAVKGLTESIRKEVEDSDICVYGVFPGGMQTKICEEKYPEDFNEYMDVNIVAEKLITNLKSENPETDLMIKRPIQ